MIRYLALLSVFTLVACATHELGEYEPVPAAGYQPNANWERDLRVCGEKYVLMKIGKAQYRYLFNECMKGLGHKIDWRASDKKYKAIEAEEKAKE